MYIKILSYIEIYKELLSFISGVAVIIAISFFYNPFVQDEFGSYSGLVKDEVHVHSDLLIYINDSHIDLTDDKYQSRTGHVLHENFHLHDNNDKVIHRHADGLTFKNFIDSLGYTLTDECLTTDEGTSYCSNQEEKLLLYVNGIINPSPSSYITEEGDQILVYYGTQDSPSLPLYLGEITADACIYSGTCPEKGTPPPESCGLTCEI